MSSLVKAEERLLPRNDYVVVRVKKRDVGPDGVELPDSSLEGKDFVIEAVGDDVEKLKKGDKVLMVGTRGEDWAYLPRSSDVLVIKEANIVGVWK